MNLEALCSSMNRFITDSLIDPKDQQWKWFNLHQIALNQMKNTFAFVASQSTIISHFNYILSNDFGTRGTTSISRTSNVKWIFILTFVRIKASTSQIKNHSGVHFSSVTHTSNKMKQKTSNHFFSKRSL